MKNTDSVQKLVSKRHNDLGVQVAWTDGACEPNPGPGGWGVLLERDGQIIAEHCGGERETTNNRMEMMAVIEAIKRTTGTLIVRTDSQLVLLCAVGRWKRKTNLDLWREYDSAAAGRDIKFEWWRGHSGTPGNEQADRLADKGMRDALSVSAVFEAPKAIDADFEQDLCRLLNRHGVDASCDTADYVLARYLTACLLNWNAIK